MRDRPLSMAIGQALVGWRVRAGFPPAASGFALLILFRYPLSWFGALLGMLVNNPRPPTC